MTATKIEWAESVWNPLRGCRRVSPGCENCYAERTAIRHAGAGRPYEGLVRSTGNGPRWTGDIRLVPHKLAEPLSWRKPRRIFVNSMSDLFHEDVPDEFIAKVWAVMMEARQHTFQVLTKRPDRARELMTRMETDRPVKYGAAAGSRLPDVPWFKSRVWQLAWGQGSGSGRLPEDIYQDGWDAHWPPKNVWLGVSVEDQQRANERIPRLLDCPAAVHWVSAEPLLGGVDFTSLPANLSPLPGESAWDWFNALSGIGEGPPSPQYSDAPVYPKLSWVVVGGESGPGARPGDVRWVRALRDQCQEAGVPVFIKQMGPTIILPGDEDLHGTGWGQYVVEEDAVDGNDRLIKFAHRKGGDPQEWTEDLRVRQYPP